MDTIYLQKPTEKLTLKENQLLLQENGEVKEVYPLASTEQVLIYGNSQITTQAVKECLKEGIRIVYFNAFGRFLGRTEPDYPKNICRRIKQYKLFLEPERRLQWAKSLIAAKLQSQKMELRRLYEQGCIFPYKEVRKKILRVMKELPGAGSIGEVMGMEGHTAKVYYDLFPHFLPKNAPCWKGRSKHPAEDQANLLLSYIYGCGANRIRQECERHSLDPHCGFLHEPGYGKGGLVYDLIELVRAPVCDHYFFIFMEKYGEELKEMEKNEGLPPAVRKKVTEGFEKYLCRKYFRQKSSADDFIKVMVNNFVIALEEENFDPFFSDLLPGR